MLFQPRTLSTSSETTYYSYSFFPNGPRAHLAAFQCAVPIPYGKPRCRGLVLRAGRLGRCSGSGLFVFKSRAHLFCISWAPILIVASLCFRIFVLFGTLVHRQQLRLVMTTLFARQAETGCLSSREEHVDPDERLLKSNLMAS